jgi:hypothetical protein
VRIAIVGGLERHEPEIARRAAALGHAVEFHRGRVGGRHAGELESMVQRCDVAVIVVEVNSHGAMYMAKRVAGQHGRPALMSRTGSPSNIGTILRSLGRPSEASAAGGM